MFPFNSTQWHHLQNYIHKPSLRPHSEKKPCLIPPPYYFCFINYFLSILSTLSHYQKYLPPRINKPCGCGIDLQTRRRWELFKTAFFSEVQLTSNYAFNIIPWPSLHCHLPLLCRLNCLKEMILSSTMTAILLSMARS